MASSSTPAWPGASPTCSPVATPPPWCWPSTRSSTAARSATELGADLLKLEYGGDREVFQHIAAAALLPIFILGGPKRPTQRETLADVVAAAEAGAVGLTIGRNVWQHAEPAKMVRALRSALSTTDLEAAMAEIG